DERLHYASDKLDIEVGSDAEMGRAGLRFPLSIPPGSTIQSATLLLYRKAGTAVSTDTMAVQVYESPSVPPFDDTHVHAPAGHATGGLWSARVNGFALGTSGTWTVSPDLSILVQHAVDRPDYVVPAYVGFVLSPDSLTGWATFTDSSAGADAAR